MSLPPSFGASDTPVTAGLRKLDLKNLDSYRSWTIKKATLPIRTTLCRLEPIGLGTPLVECLTSYATRLAQAHCLSVGKLICNVVAPFIGKPYLRDARDAARMNKHDVVASDFVRALESLTGFSGLGYLTTVPFYSLFREPGLTRSRRAWCPDCYEEQREKRQIYDPLLWVLEAVNACPLHRRPLQTGCPHCGVLERWLEKRSIAGHCSKCGQWLGPRRKGRELGDPQKLDPDFPFILWTAESLKDILGVLPSTTRFLTPEEITDQVKRIAGQHGMRLPSRSRMMKTVLRICHAVHVMPLTLLTGDLQVLESRVQLGQLIKKKRTRQGVNWQQIQESFNNLMNETPPLSVKEIVRRLKQCSRPQIVKLLCKNFPKCRHLLSDRRADEHRKGQIALVLQFQNLVSSNIYPPPSLTQIAGQFKVSPQVLRAMCPQLCEIITGRRTKWKQKQRELIEEEVREVGMALHRRGMYPSFPRVSALLKTPSHLVRERYRNVLRQLQRELGYRT
ncbi:MAG: hypothetical protein JWM21_869 [Acidobacteria bacterium]|nr:hypothetical protein [Acidobacteriota bacterium]